ncbi:hypothetical protein [Haloarcula litorea]|uniref:hypothetical protein n=1 Tax=Haloarcula litorea TaxID=3032579 RepID=UPI0023E77A02|nr:hypothetical protein [Halomicroarcula sp. GDY20]
MSDDPPRPPSDLPAEVVDALDDCSPERLAQIATYAEELAEYREREARPTGDGDRTGTDREDLPPDVPSKATITVKEINGNRYYYWQWREGDSIVSKYKGPVAPDD